MDPHARHLGHQLDGQFGFADGHRNDGAHLIRARADDGDSLADARKVLARPFIIRAREHGWFRHGQFISTDNARGQGNDRVCHGAMDADREWVGTRLCVARVAGVASFDETAPNSTEFPASVLPRCYPALDCHRRK
jgi:hypothetical protein